MSSAPLPSPDAVNAAVDLLAAAGHPSRLLVLVALARRGPMSAGELQELAGTEQTAMSHQLRALKRAHLVVSERRGRHMIYQLVDHHVAHIVEDALTHAAETRR